MLYILRSTKNMLDQGSDLYTKAIIRECIKRSIAYDVVEVASQQELDAIAQKHKFLALEPCEFTVPQNENNLETNITAKVVRSLCNKIRGKEAWKTNVLIINRSDLIGRPLGRMLLDDDFTITVAHSKTPEVQSLIEVNHIIVLATGHNLDHLDLQGKDVIDVSNDYSLIEKTVSYVGRRKVGKMTTDILLDLAEEKS